MAIAAQITLAQWGRDFAIKVGGEPEVRTQNLGKLPRDDISTEMSTVEQIEEAIERLDVKGQVQLLRELPARLKIEPDNVAWLKLAELAFAFWDNPADAAYDEL